MIQFILTILSPLIFTTFDHMSVYIWGKYVEKMRLNHLCRADRPDTNFHGGHTYANLFYNLHWPLIMCASERVC